MLPRSGERGSTGDRGETLVEVLITVVILGIAGVAIMAGLELSVKSSQIGRSEANGGSYVRSLAEAIQNSVTPSGGYKSCAAANAYLTSAVKTLAGLPSTYTPNQSAAKQWNGTAWVAPSLPCTDNGSQQITLTVTSPGTGVHKVTETLNVVIRRPCTGSVPSVASPSATPC